MFENVYFNIKAKSEDDKAEYIITELYNYYFKNMDKLPLEYQRGYENNQSSRKIGYVIILQE